MKSIASIILAAGKGTRMKSSLPKALHKVAGNSMISYSLELLKSLGIEKKIVVIGNKADKIKEEVGNIDPSVTFALQEEQLGTAHAIQQAESCLTGFSGTILILYTDVPLLRSSTIKDLIDSHTKCNSNCTVLTAFLDNPAGYGRIIRDTKGIFTKIVEQRDLAANQEQVNEVNAGIYCFDSEKLFSMLKLVKNDNSQKEYYLTDVIKILLKNGNTVSTVTVQDKEEILGVNTRLDLSSISRILYKRNATEHMLNGVTIVDENNTYIEKSVQIGQDTVIYPFTIITEGSVIGTNCHIGPYSHIVNSSIGQETSIYSSVVEKSKIGIRTNVGPYTHIRPGTIIGDEVRIGNYVEVKKSFIDNGSKVGHLTYIGDAKLGKKVNIGAGTITCNYDGKNKNPTTIKDGVFIGSNNSLVAPVTIEKDSYTAAGSTITTNVPEKSLGIARAKQKNIPGWVEKKSKKKNTE